MRRGHRVNATTRRQTVIHFNIRSGLVLVGCVMGMMSAQAQTPSTFPQRSVTVIVPFTPGTSADVISRILSPLLSEKTGVSLVTENRPGAGGNLGAEIVARSKPDGHTLMLTATAFGTAPVVNKNTPFDPINDFKPIGLAATSAMALVANPQVPANSISDLVQLAKKEPGKLNYASPGPGTAQHLAVELLKQESGIDMLHVPYKGTAGALTDLVAGHVQVMVTSLAAAAPFVAGKQLKMLAILSAERSEEYPETSTVLEQGHPNLVVDTWYGYFAPKGTPDEVVNYWNRQVNEVLSRPEIKKKLQEQGLTAKPGAPDVLGSLIRSELSKWKQVVDKAQIAE